MKKFTTHYLPENVHLTHMREDEQEFTKGRTSTYMWGYTDGKRDRNYDGYYKHVDIMNIQYRLFT